MGSGFQSKNARLFACDSRGFYQHVKLFEAGNLNADEQCIHQYLIQMMEILVKTRRGVCVKKIRCVLVLKTLIRNKRDTEDIGGNIRNADGFI